MDERPVHVGMIREAIARGLDGGTRPIVGADLDLLARQLEGHAGGLLSFEAEERVTSRLEGSMRDAAALILGRTRQMLAAVPGERLNARPFYVEDLAGVVRSLLALHDAVLEPV
ncbi:DUF6415 family natural product biosynthesis protein [Streptomyces sp. NPDC058398]|uniref:DUF6415 family natural product biosynthesis protein n=1 Tax=Streptomyces sp. NPDC058398 TaxID=3346479 RepID=UPI00365D579E